MAVLSKQSTCRHVTWNTHSWQFHGFYIAHKLGGYPQRYRFRLIDSGIPKTAIEKVWGSSYFLFYLDHCNSDLIWTRVLRAEEAHPSKFDDLA